MNNTSKKPRKTSSSAEQLAACSLISGIAGIICSLFYLPFSLVSGKNTPMGLICGVIGIVLAIMAKTRTSVRERNIQVRHWLVLSSV